MGIKKVFRGMLDNTVITSSQELKDAIDIIGEVLQAEEGELSRIGNFYTPDYKKTKEFYTDISTRYDSETFVNILRDYKNMPKTVNKLIPIHRRRASNNIMKLLTKEYFKGYVIEISYDEEKQEMLLEIFVDADTEVDKAEVYRVFEKVKNRLLIAGIRKVLRIILRVVDWIIPPDERWLFKMEGMYDKLEPPILDLSTVIDPIEEIYFNNVWFTMRRSRMNIDKHRLFYRDPDNDNTAYMSEFYITKVEDVINQPAPLDYFVTWKAGYDDLIVSPIIEYTTILDEFEVFYFNEQWFKVGRNQLNSIYRLFSGVSERKNLVMMSELYTYNPVIFEPVKDPIYWVTRKDVTDLEINSMGISLTVKNIDTEPISAISPVDDVIPNFIITVTEVPPEYCITHRNAEDEIIIDPAEFIISKDYDSYGMVTPLPSELYPEQETNADRKINVPSNKMSIWYPDTKQLGVGLFVIGKNRLTREYAEFVVE